MPKHSGSDGFQDGLPGICDKCFKEQKPSERYYCPHNERLAGLTDGYRETFRDASPDEEEEEGLVQLRDATKLLLIRTDSGWKLIPIFFVAETIAAN